MSTTYTFEYSKPGAVFDSAESAIADKNSLFSPELQALAPANFQAMRDAGILINSASNWDQATHTLTLTNEVSDADAFLAASRKDGIGSQIITQSELAGWTYLNNDRT
jgi:hypothetical protein